jgi:hypothetical protein
MASSATTCSTRPVVVDVAGRGDDQRTGPVVLAPVAHDHVARHRLDGGGRADDHLAEPGAGEDRVGHLLGDDLGRVVGVHGDLVEDDRALRVDVGAADPRGRDHVGQDVDRDVTVVGEHAGVEARVLLRGVRVQLAAARLHGRGDLLGGAPARALEQHVLEEVRGTVARRALVPRPDAGEDPHAEGAAGGHRLRDHGEPVGQHRTTHGAVHRWTTPCVT